MQRNWFGDERDLWKWTVAIRTARRVEAEIVYVAMMQTNKRDQRCDYEPVVRDFFRGEHSLEDIPDLGVRAGLRIIPFLESYTRPKWKEYFEPIITHLVSRSPSTRSVVLMDPDTGLWSGNPTTRHVRQDELQRIWQEIRPGDVLLVYQHQQREGGWDRASAKKLAACLQVAPDRIGQLKCNDVCMLEIERT
jgi:hypothetical protein